MPKAKQAHAAAKKDGAPVMPHRDLYHRLNYTIQAGAFLQNLAGPSSSEEDLVVDRKGKRKAAAPSREENVGGIDVREVARESMKTSRRMIAHNQLKVDPTWKRGSCSTCGTVLVPGLTSRVRNRHPSHHHISRTTCLTCSAVRSIPNPPLPLPLDIATGKDPSDKESKLDGPVRAARRTRIAAKRKVPFHERETAHTLWAADRKLSNWGGGGGPSSSSTSTPA